MLFFIATPQKGPVVCVLPPVRSFLGSTGPPVSGQGGYHGTFFGARGAPEKGPVVRVLREKGGGIPLFSVSGPILQKGPVSANPPTTAPFFSTWLPRDPFSEKYPKIKKAPCYR